MNIGAKIRELRKEKKVTQEELADYLHISSQAVSKWETGASSPDIDMLPKLAIFFGTSLDHLLDFDQSRVDAAVEALIEESGRGFLEKLCKHPHPAGVSGTPGDPLEIQAQRRDDLRRLTLLQRIHSPRLRRK